MLAQITASKFRSLILALFMFLKELEAILKNGMEDILQQLLAREKIVNLRSESNQIARLSNQIKKLESEKEMQASEVSFQNLVPSTFNRPLSRLSLLHFHAKAIVRLT